MEYHFQKKKRGSAYNLFAKGFDLTAVLLFNIKENIDIAKEGFLTSCPNYPGFDILRAVVNPQKDRSKLSKEAVRKNLERLIQQGLVFKDPKQKIYCLTDKGENFTSYIENRFIVLKNPWDGKLRLVIFDIPEKAKNWRYSLRQELILMQFKQLQKSVYIGKYPMPQSLIDEIEEAGLGKNFFIFTIDEADRYREIIDFLEKD